MDIDGALPKFDIPKDFIVGDNISCEILNMYGLFPCKIKAGVFAFCLRGTIRATINLKEYNIGASDFVSLLPNSFIQIHEVSADAQVSFAAFSSQFLEGVNYIKTISSLLITVMENPIMSLNENTSSVYRDFFSLLVKADADPDAILLSDSLHSVLDIFVRAMSNLYKKGSFWKDPAMTRDKEIAREFIQLVWENYTQEHSVSFYADRIRITLPHFCYVIRKSTGQTALDIIANVIILDAKAQLKSTNIPIKEIAANLGYNNAAFFDKYFKRHVGMSPMEYRNS